MTSATRVLYGSTPAGLRSGDTHGGFGSWYSQAERELGRCTADPAYPGLLAEHARVVGTVTDLSDRTTQLLAAGRETARDQAWIASRVKPWPDEAGLAAPAVPEPAAVPEIDWDRWLEGMDLSGLDPEDLDIDFDFDLDAGQGPVVPGDGTGGPGAARPPERLLATPSPGRPAEPWCRTRLR